MDAFDAAAVCTAASPWDSLRATFHELRVEVNWDAIPQCPLVQFPVVKLLPSAPGLFAFVSPADDAAHTKGGLGAVTDVVMKISWEPRRGGGGERVLRVVVIAPGVGDDGAVGTLACPPTPSEEVWATLTLLALPKLAAEAGYTGDTAPDIWSGSPLRVSCEATVKVPDLRTTLSGTVTVSGTPVTASGVSISTAGLSRKAPGSQRFEPSTLPFSARPSARTTARGDTDDGTTSTSGASFTINRIVPRVRPRPCRHCGKELAIPNGQPDDPTAPSPIVCRCGCVFYCTSRCQALDWTGKHDLECGGFGAAGASVRDLWAFPMFPWVDDTTRLIACAATCVCDVLASWDLHDGVPAWKHVPGCECFPVVGRDPMVSPEVPTHLRPWGPPPSTKSALALTLYAPCKDWADVYRVCKLPGSAPDALVYTHAATLYHVIRVLGARNQVSVQGNDPSGGEELGDDVIVVDCLQPPACVSAFPAQFRLVQHLLGGAVSVHVRAVGDTVPADLHGKILSWAPPARDPSAAVKVLPRAPKRVHPGTLCVSFHRTDDLAGYLTDALGGNGGVPLPDVLLGLDAGLAFDPTWAPVLPVLSVLTAEGLPLFVTERNLFAASHAHACLVQAECVKAFPLTCNPFRGPLACPATPCEDPRAAVPSVPNGFLVGFGVEALADEGLGDIGEEEGVGEGGDDSYEGDDALAEVDDDLDATGDDDDEASSDGPPDDARATE